MLHRFTKGSLWNLTIDANCIPAGKYTFWEEQGELVIFGVGSSIRFGLAKEFYLPFLQPIRRGSAKETSVVKFVTRYANLYQTRPPSTFSPSRFTFCVMARRVQERFSELTRLGDRMCH